MNQQYFVGADLHSRNDAQRVYCTRRACQWVGCLFEVNGERGTNGMQCLCPRCGALVQLDKPDFVYFKEPQAKVQHTSPESIG